MCHVVIITCNLLRSEHVLSVSDIMEDASLKKTLKEPTSATDGKKKKIYFCKCLKFMNRWVCL